MILVQRDRNGKIINELCPLVQCVFIADSDYFFYKKARKKIRKAFKHFVKSLMKYEEVASIVKVSTCCSPINQDTRLHFESLNKSKFCMPNESANVLTTQDFLTTINLLNKYTVEGDKPVIQNFLIVISKNISFRSGRYNKTNIFSYQFDTEFNNELDFYEIANCLLRDLGIEY